MLAGKYARLEGAEDAIFLSSGMGATALAHLAVLRPGDHLVSSSWIYGGTQQLFDEELTRFGIDVTYVRPDQPRLWRKSVRKATRAIFVETPTNPLMRVVDLAPVAHVAREYGLALLVDATFASPINFRPLEHGADIVITSATKYLNGHSDVIAGVVAGSASFVEEVNRLMRLWGQAIDPHAAWLVDRGMRTLALRMARHNANGAAVAAVGDEACRVRQGPLSRPPDHPDHELAAKVLDGFGGMVGLELAGGAKSGASVAQPGEAGDPRAQPGRRRDPGERAAVHVAQGALRRAARRARDSGRVPPAELRHRGRRRHHRGPRRGARQRLSAGRPQRRFPSRFRRGVVSFRP